MSQDEPAGQVRDGTATTQTADDVSRSGGGARTPIPVTEPAVETRPTSTFNWTPYLFALPLLVFAAAFFLFPIVRLAFTTLLVDDGSGLQLTTAPFVRLVEDDYSVGIITRTLRVSLLATLVTLVLSYPVVLWMRQIDAKWRGLLVILMLSPLLMSVVVRTLGWIVLLGTRGFLNETLAIVGVGPLNLLYRESAMVLGLAHVFLGFMVLALLTSVLKIPDNVISAAFNLGANQWQVLRDVIWPMSRPGVIAGVAIVFPLAASAYVTPSLLGGSRNPVMATEVYRQSIVQLNWERASATALALFVLITLVTVLLGFALRGSRRAASE